jgi:hypothetical protein
MSTPTSSNQCNSVWLAQVHQMQYMAGRLALTSTAMGCYVLTGMATSPTPSKDNTLPAQSCLAAMCGTGKAVSGMLPVACWVTPVACWVTREDGCLSVWVSAYELVMNGMSHRLDFLLF